MRNNLASLPKNNATELTDFMEKNRRLNKFMQTAAKSEKEICIVYWSYVVLDIGSYTYNIMGQCSSS